MMKKLLVVLFCILILVGTYVANGYAYYAQEVNDSWETAIFVKSGDIITGQFETDGDIDVFKFIVEVPGTLKIDFKPQKTNRPSPASIRIKIYDSRFNLVKRFADIFNIPSDREPDFQSLRHNFLERGLYYLQIESTVIADVWDITSSYELRITAENGLVLATEECHPSNLSGCVDQTSCESAGGYWYLETCHQKPCTREVLHLCPDRESCLRADGFWNDRLGACFQVDIDGLYRQGYEEGRRYCREHPEECGIEICEANTANGATSSNNETSSGPTVQINMECVATYDLFSNTVRIPCFQGADGVYWVDLELIRSQPTIDLRVKGVGRIEGESR